MVTVVCDQGRSSGLVRRTVSVIGFPIDALTWESAVSQILSWAERRESRIVCICNTHSLVTARDDPDFGSVIGQSDMNTADGAPVAWLMRAVGERSQRRINGPDLMWRTCHALNRVGAPSIFLYGNTEVTNIKLIEKLKNQFPSLRIAGFISPPFRELTQDELYSHISQINESEAGIVWVSLGCPKQEKWMLSNRSRISAVMIGVGAAFDYHAETIRRAPRWMQNAGLEWLHRLSSEPRRLWRRYLYNNTHFTFRALAQIVLGR